jgi:hypothetical protein
MSRLIVQKFSCIEQADIELANLTLIIGPQASGKSLISKLIYFFYEIILRQYQSLEEASSIQKFKVELEDKFKRWFPPSGWGKEKFSIKFEAGPFSASIRRSSLEVAEKVSVSFSKFFSNEYTSLLTALKEAIEKEAKANSNSELDPEKKIRLFWHIQRLAEEKFKKALGKDSLNTQIFIPAGRSFFTNIGKGIAVFEHSKAMDSTTISFGRLFSYLISDPNWRFMFQRGKDPANSYQKEFKKKLLGGEIEHLRNGEINLVTEDGRKLSLPYTSSSQQELYPLLLTLEYVERIQQRVKHISKDSKLLLFIEEPEAHLFPSAQAAIIDYIASLAVEVPNPNRTLITTHSPYILAQVNNLLKAGQLADKMGGSVHSKLGKIIRKESWLPPGSTAAYAIVDGRSRSIVEDGLIDGSYIDDASAEISHRFASLLEIEYGNAKE